MPKHVRPALILLVLAGFCVLGVVRHLHMFGEDLASSYVGCRLLAAGQGDHLFSHSQTNFSVVGDSVWYDMARHSGYTELKQLHPYVQTPLWAWSLIPACTTLEFRTFCNLYIALFMVCTSALLWLVARFWAPALFHPLSIAVVFAALYLSEPFKYSIFLAQTHILFVLLTVAALLLAERGKPHWAGLALALAAAVKITPGLLFLYWLLTRRWRAAASFAIFSAVLLGAGFLAVGPGLMRDYLHSLAENGRVLLVAFNNQSLAGWWGGRSFPRTEILRWHMYVLPAGLKLMSLLLSVAGAVAGGWLDRRSAQTMPTTRSTPPYGAVIAMLAATAFAPIAWSHYYIILVIPVMLLWAAFRADHKPLWLAFLLVILALNLYPISFGDVHLYYKSFSIVRSQFYAGLLAAAAMFALGWTRPTHATATPASAGQTA